MRHHDKNFLKIFGSFCELIFRYRFFCENFLDTRFFVFFKVGYRNAPLARLFYAADTACFWASETLGDGIFLAETFFSHNGKYFTFVPDHRHAGQQVAQKETILGLNVQNDAAGHPENYSAGVLWFSPSHTHAYPIAH